ncbi:Uncharacterized protein OBRU01_07480 [Operophtera brumata]|uniref:Uncharacterized protein n=1 Tax=Operophtera brumata TaxID=104452 RepID=A0A0L7LJD4_OPEBR|nr:Uncharacterized protein OBRU01_07480 [Operophtera brumata]
MSGENNSDSSTSESEVSACSSSFNPFKALYSQKSKAPAQNAPMFENIQQYEASLKNKEIIPVGGKDRVQKREKEKELKRIETERMLEEKNRQRFANLLRDSAATINPCSDFELMAMARFSCLC